MVFLVMLALDLAAAQLSTTPPAVAQTVAPQTLVAQAMTAQTAVAAQTARPAPSSVGDVIATLKRFGRDHLLVVQSVTAQTPQRVRGVISRAQIERALF